MGFLYHADRALDSPAGRASDDHVDIAAERGEQAHQALARQAGNPAVQQRGHLGLVHAHLSRGCGLGEPPLLDDLPDEARELSLREFFTRFREPEVGVEIPRFDFFWNAWRT